MSHHLTDIKTTRMDCRDEPVTYTVCRPFSFDVTFIFGSDKYFRRLRNGAERKDVCTILESLIGEIRSGRLNEYK
jgi:hypothetical protein